MAETGHCCLAYGPCSCPCISRCWCSSGRTHAISVTTSAEDKDASIQLLLSKYKILATQRSSQANEFRYSLSDMARPTLKKCLANTEFLQPLSLSLSLCMYGCVCACVCMGGCMCTCRGIGCGKSGRGKDCYFINGKRITAGHGDQKEIKMDKCNDVHVKGHTTPIMRPTKS